MVDVRTVKRWMRSPVMREALLAVRHGKQWRIPHPDDEWIWKMHTRHRLKAVGVPLKPGWEKALDQAHKKCQPYQLESYRLWLAAYSKALERGRITTKARLAALQLWQEACRILRPFKSRLEIEVDKLKANFSRELLRYWPSKEHFKRVQDAYTLRNLETIRRRLDFTQAVRELKRRGKKPAERNLRPLLHEDMRPHINDTREKLNPLVVDWRQPQRGLTLRSFRRRYPLRRQPWRDIVAGVYGIRAIPPGASKPPKTGLTPIRSSKDDVSQPFRRAKSRR